MSLPSVIQAYLQGNTVRAPHLVELCLATQARRFWNGSYELVTNDGRHWFGLNKLGSIEGLSDPGTLESAELRFTVSGVDARMLTLAATMNREEYVNRDAVVLIQFLDDDWQLLDDPIEISTGILDVLEVSRQPDGEGGSHRTISVRAQNMFYGRGIPPASFFTNNDQQQRSPGDRGLTHMAELLNTNIPFPW